tara:strand:- start:63 stop:470 length:408 start_codon:yes stop_codon:yes gene_type:complete
MRKAEILAYWNDLPDNGVMEPSAVPYRHTGSSYTQDTVRITGSQEFIDSWLSGNKALLRYENEDTRLALTYRETVDRDTDQHTGKYQFYLSVRARGPRARSSTSSAPYVSELASVSNESPAEKAITLEDLAAEFA